MNIVKIAFFLVASQTFSFGLTFTNQLKSSITGIVFEDTSSIYFETKTLISVSKQIYNLNGFKVNEVVLDLSSSPSQIKVYSIQGPSPSQIGNQTSTYIQRNTDYATAKATLENANKALQNIKYAKVSENAKLPSTVNNLFPVSTHSRTLEFSVSSIDELEKFYDKMVSIFSDKTSSESLKGALFKFEKK